MMKVKIFFSTLFSTFISPEYYKKVVRAPLSFSLKFFFFYFFLYAIVATSFTYLKILSFQPFLALLPTKIQQIYPDGLEIKVINGQASTNVREPYTVSLESVTSILSGHPLPDNLKKGIKNLFVIDTNGSIEKFASYQTLVLLTQNHLAIMDENRKITVYPLNDMENIVIDKSLIGSITAQFASFLYLFIPVLLTLSFFIFFVFVPVAKIVYVMSFSLLLLIVIKLLSLPLSYKQCFQIGLHLIIIPTTIFGLLSLLGFSPSFPLLQTIIMLILGSVILHQIKERDMPPPISTKSS